MGSYDISVGRVYPDVTDAVLFFEMLDAARKADDKRLAKNTQLQDELSGATKSELESGLDDILKGIKTGEDDNYELPRQQDLEDLLRDIDDESLLETTKKDVPAKLLADIAAFTAKTENGEDDIESVEKLTLEDLKELIDAEYTIMVESENYDEFCAARGRYDSYKALADFYEGKPYVENEAEVVASNDVASEEPTLEEVPVSQVPEIKDEAKPVAEENPFSVISQDAPDAKEKSLTAEVEDALAQLAEMEEEENSPVAVEPETEDDFAEIIAGYYENGNADTIKKMTTNELYTLYDNAVDKYNEAVKNNDNNTAEFYSGFANAVNSLAEIKANVPAVEVAEEEKPVNLLADLVQKPEETSAVSADAAQVAEEQKPLNLLAELAKETSVKKESADNMLEQLLQANIKANESKRQKPVQFASAPKESRSKEIENRTGQDYITIGKGIISPISAVGGLYDIATGDFDAGQKQVRAAASDFLTAPAGALNVANDVVEAVINDVFGETAGRVAAAPANFISGAWQTVSTSIDGKEGTTKKAFLNMVSFGFCK